LVISPKHAMYYHSSEVVTIIKDNRWQCKVVQKSLPLFMAQRICYLCRCHEVKIVNYVIY
jgi:hypothetical protein